MLQSTKMWLSPGLGRRLSNLSLCALSSAAMALMTLKVSSRKPIASSIWNIISKTLMTIVKGEVAVVIGLSNSDLEDLSERTITDSEGNPLTIYVAPEDEEKEGKEAIAATAAPAAASSSRICANVGLFFMILKI